MPRASLLLRALLLRVTRYARRMAMFMMRRYTRMSLARALMRWRERARRSSAQRDIYSMAYISLYLFLLLFIEIFFAYRCFRRDFRFLLR